MPCTRFMPSETTRKPQPHTPHSATPRTSMGDISPTAKHPSIIPNVVDLTHPLISSGVPAAEGHPCYTTHCISHVNRGDVSTIHGLTLGTHTGTHIDAPYHFFDNGTTVDQLDLSLLTAAPAVVADMRWKKARERIIWDDLRKYEERFKPGVALLLCTGWSRNWCKASYNQHPFLDQDAAKMLLKKGVRVIAMDTMSPDEVTDENGDSCLVHHAFLGNGGIIVENLNGLEQLLQVDASHGDLRVSFLPLRLTECDGSPIRAVAWLERA